MTDNRSSGQVVADAPSTRQVMLSHAYLTYCGDRITTPGSDAEIGTLITSGIAAIPVLCTVGSDGTSSPNWQLVWGPVTYTPAGALYQDNLMYVAQNLEDTSQYVIAIRGTNHVSDLDWLLEDFDVLQQMPWPPNSSGDQVTGMISESTSVALQILLAMQNGSGQSLAAFLKTVTTEIQLWVTGHSLGGCLASALGVWLLENRGAWAADSGSTVSGTTFAAPTAGNMDFANLVTNGFADTMFDCVQCTLDIVPLAWGAGNLVDMVPPTPSTGLTPYTPTSSAIFDIYDQTEEEWDGSEVGIDFKEMAFPYDDVWKDEVLGSLLPNLQLNVFLPLNYNQPAVGLPMLSGKFNSDFTAYDDDFTPTFEAFMAQAAYQHSASYPTLLDVPQLLDPAIINETGTTDGAVDRAATRAAGVKVRLITAAIEGMARERLKPPTPTPGEQRRQGDR